MGRFYWVKRGALRRAAVSGLFLSQVAVGQELCVDVPVVGAPEENVRYCHGDSGAGRLELAPLLDEGGGERSVGSPYASALLPANGAHYSPSHIHCLRSRVEGRIWVATAYWQSNTCAISVFGWNQDQGVAEEAFRSYGVAINGTVYEMIDSVQLVEVDGAVLLVGTAGPFGEPRGRQPGMVWVQRLDEALLWFQARRAMVAGEKWVDSASERALPVQLVGGGACTISLAALGEGQVAIVSRERGGRVPTVALGFVGWIVDLESPKGFAVESLPVIPDVQNFTALTVKGSSQGLWLGALVENGDVVAGTLHVYSLQWNATSWRLVDVVENPLMAEASQVVGYDRRLSLDGERLVRGRPAVRIDLDRRKYVVR